MAPPKIQIDPEVLARARALYENGTSLDVIGRLMGVSGQTVRNRANELGWSRSRPTREGIAEDKWPDAPPPMREPTDEEAAPEAIVARLGRLIAREMLRTESYDHSPEVAARTLVMLSRSASILHAIHKPEEHPAPEQHDEREQLEAAHQTIADVVARFKEICEDEGEESLLRRMRHAPQLMPLVQLVIGERRRVA